MKRKQIALRVVLIIIAVFILAITGYGVYVYQNLSKEIDLSLIQTGGSSVTRIYYYDENNQAVELTDEEIFLSRSEWCSLYDMPKNLSNAFIAIEDHRFYEHGGVDWLRTAKAGLNYLFKFDKSSYGGSTITQQLIKNLTGDNEVTPKRKLEEVFRATNLEKELGKNEILELYLNIVYLSENCYGISSASDLYFQKKPSELTLAECASLAGIVKNPSYYDPYKNPDKNKERSIVVLTQMLEYGYITNEEYENAVNETLVINPNVEEERNSGIYSWFTEALLDDVIKDISEKYQVSEKTARMSILKGGINIYATIDPNLQKYAEIVCKNARAYIPNCEMPQGGCVVIDPQTSNIKAIVGGYGEKEGNLIFNRATDALRPLGSVIKPLSVYGPSIESREITMATIIDDTPFSIQNGAPWPKNSPNLYRGLVSVNYGLTHSVNTVSVKLLNRLGISDSYDFLTNQLNFTLVENDKAYAPLALGQLTNGETLLKTTNAYTMFANGGKLSEPKTYYKVTDRYGNVILENESTEKQVISPQSAYIMTKMMENVVNYGTSRSLNNQTGMKISAKTGTTSDNYDRWYIGYTPYYVCGVWTGYDTPKELHYTYNPSMKIFEAVMNYAHLNKEYKEFSVPDGIVEANYCKDSGLLETDACRLDLRGGRTEKGYFIQGTEPKYDCELHKEEYIDSASGLIADEQTPFLRRRLVSLLDYQREKIGNYSVIDEEYLISSRKKRIK